MGRDARLDEHAVSGGGEIAGAQIAHGSSSLRCYAAEADAHVASRRHENARGFACVQEGLGAVDGDGVVGTLVAE